MIRKTLFLLTAFVWIQGCALVARDGPTTGAIESPSTNSAGEPNYTLVGLNKDVSKKVKDYHDQVIPLEFSDLPPALPVGQIGTGDILHITIWEATPQQSGVFTQGRGAEVIAVVDEKGDISVPYAGRFNISGMSLAQIESTIVAKLKGKAYTPQVSVQLAENVANTVFVQGEVGHPGRFPLTPGGNTLLNLVALAGGPRLQPHETMVQVNRAGKSVTTDLYRIMNDPLLNITLSPGDSVIVTRRSDMFYAFGAVNRTGQVPFSEHTTTLLQALGAIYGLQDQRADPKGVFIFRREPKELVDQLRSPSVKKSNEETLQVVYRLNMDDPDSIFSLNAFPVRPSDVIYVSNAPLREFQKVVDSILGSTGSALNTGLSAATLSKQ